MKEYPVVRTIYHDGREYPPGSTVELAEENAKYLLRRGDISKPLEQSTDGVETENKEEA